MDATSHITTLFPTVSGRQLEAPASHRSLRLLGESATSASTRPKSACRNVKHKRRCRLHLFRGPRPTPFFFLHLTVPVLVPLPARLAAHEDGFAASGL